MTENKLASRKQLAAEMHVWRHRLQCHLHFKTLNGASCFKAEKEELFALAADYLASGDNHKSVSIISKLVGNYKKISANC